jgi:choline dehydrogenase-like flavoprotein
MIVTWPELKARQAPYDVIIVGGGAAGLTLAEALIGSGLEVLVLEAGGVRDGKRAREPFQGEVVDPTSHPWLEHFRVRAVGGASRIWGGRCIPLDPIDFERRPWAPGPGWPYGLDTLDLYYRRAQVAAEAGEFDYDPASVLPGRPSELAPGLDGPMLTTRLERFSRPTDFWRRFGKAIAAAPRTGLLMNAPVTRIRLGADGRRVDHLELRDPAGSAFALRARHYVLAAGGLESVRLLLASNDVIPGGVGSSSGALGRYYMSHLAASAGLIVFNRPADVAFDYETDVDGIYVRRRIALTQQAQREIQALNIIFRTHLPDPADPAHGDPILSGMYLVKDLILYEYSRKLRERAPTWRGRMAHIANVARRPLRIMGFGQDWIRRRILADRKLPSVVLGSNTGAYALEFHAEQSPNPDSTIRLADTRDSLGMPRLRVDWRMAPIDTDSVERAYALLDQTLRQSDVGRVDYVPGEPTQRARQAGAYGGHHLGGARMSLEPRDGVVDADLTVHGVDNLSVVGGAVFPTSGQANPTLTILALSLRLADRLKTALRRLA